MGTNLTFSHADFENALFLKQGNLIDREKKGNVDQNFKKVYLKTTQIASSPQ